MNEKNEVLVIGGGVVGVTCAVELQRRGARVTLVDRKEPGSETSYGNAGVLATSSLVPFNNPNLLRNLPTLLKNKGVGFRYNPSYLMSMVGWGAKFLFNARRARYEETAAALHGLISLSATEHGRLLREADITHRLRSNGWIFLYRNAGSFAGSALARQTYDRYGVSYKLLSEREIADMEPGLTAGFHRGIWMDGTSSVDSPGAVTKAYARLFAGQGGTLARASVSRLRQLETGRWQAATAGGDQLEADRVVVATGPWANDVLASLGIRVPMAFERGYHMHFGTRNGATLNRPVYDVAGGYVLAPMEQGIRLGSGVELNDRDADPDTTQLDICERTARAIFPLADRLESIPWLGRRPTLPDSKPVIGETPGRRGLWLAFGHQHIGFNTSAGTAALLGALMYGDKPPVDPQPFRAARFI
ncbi:MULTISPECIES: FAD-binding oxidoreductase [unclassified Achromobacter]|uniref:NAD(P)/FAD-dependent oxidoreductase n=1 Tax=unclassified Achromobacter TaxID=2626865 RepID=UPI000B51A919|nr:MULTISPECIES: FAD-dependent oxidoreductase [unclassified Achromobacter]OWT68880.1 amino acid dehydrogenase [Achromobacter sp. HZ28]OWT78557.1 amino acid dehydrogenase [Achromobacter sp. HZ34]